MFCSLPNFFGLSVFPGVFVEHKDRGDDEVRVLVVDDAMFMRNSLKIILERNDIEVVGMAGNGLEAISQYKSLKPDVVTMDITMPEMDGLEALKEIIKLDKAAKVVMITAVGKEETVREAVISGARNFIVKPFQEEKVITVMKKL